jgi:hypothetical protein
MSWAYLPESIREQAAVRWGVAGPGDGFVYRWVAAEPSAGYCGPMPFGQLLSRFRD